VAVDHVTDAEIVEALEKLIEDDVSPGTFVVIEADSARGYYIQFAIQGDRLFCEAVSNQYLEPQHQLDADQLRALENLGWRQPDYEAQNWFRTFRPAGRADYDEIVTLVHKAFAAVYRLPEDAPLAMTRSWDGQVLAPETEIRFASEGHRSTYERVAGYVGELYGDDAEVDSRRPLVFVQHGSAVTTVAVNPIVVHLTVLDFHSLVVRDIETTPELMRWLLRRNHQLRMGALSLDLDGDIVLKHSLLGDTVTREELQIVLATLVELADELDDEITGRFGGYTARDWAYR